MSTQEAILLAFLAFTAAVEMKARDGRAQQCADRLAARSGADRTGLCVRRVGHRLRSGYGASVL
jgi:hypothetical protein